MSARVRIPSHIGRLYGAQEWEHVEAPDVSALITALDARFPGLGERLTEPGGQLRRWVNMYLNGEDIRQLGGLQAPLPPDAEVYIVPAIAGGCMRGSGF